MHSNHSLLKQGFKRFPVGGLCELLLEVEYLNDLWFATNSTLKKMIELKKKEI